MSKRASGGTLAAFLFFAAIVGFAGGAYLGTQSGSEAQASGDESGTNPPADESGSEADADPEPTDDETEPPADGAVVMQFDQSSVSAGGEVAYSGRLESGEEGVQLKLQRSVDGGEWEDFPVDARVTDSNGEFSGTVASSRSGENRFRVIGIDDETIVSEPAVLNIS